MNAQRPILILTRPAEGATRFAAQVAARFGDQMTVIQSPMQKIVWRDVAPRAGFGGYIFTSQSGVLGWVRDDNAQRGFAYCVGERTTALANAQGFQAINAGADVSALIARVIAEKPAGPLLHVRGQFTQGELATQLYSAGIETEEAIVYDQQPVEMTDEAHAALSGNVPVIAPLFSPRSAALFSAALPAGAQPWVAVISANAAERLDLTLHRRMIVAKEPNADGMLDAIEEILTRLSST